jgi:hypothetical protein
MTDVWKTIPGYSGYESSTDGNVRKKDGTEISQVLTGIPQYYYVNIYNDDGFRVLRRVHVLVALAHIENPDDLPIVDHKDRDKLNNSASNLRWVSGSDNQRNQDASIWIDGVHLLEYCERYENPRGAYSYIQPRCKEFGVDKTLEMYEEFLQRGYDRRKIEWKGEQVYFTDLCKQYGVNPSDVSCRLRNGYPVWNAVFNVPETQPNSIEVGGTLGISYWFPSRKYLSCETGKSVGVVREFIANGYTLEQMIRHDSLDHYRQEILGVFGTVVELCKHFNVSEDTVAARMYKQGMSLEEALTCPLQRIRWVVLNGNKMSVKSMYESFGLNAKKLNSWRSTNNASIEDSLQAYGISLDGISLSY